MRNIGEMVKKYLKVFLKKIKEAIIGIGIMTMELLNLKEHILTEKKRENG